jgi:hypothetical protein
VRGAGRRRRCGRFPCACNKHVVIVFY